MPVKILYFHHAIGLGGAPQSLSLLIGGLDRNRFDPVVVMPRRAGNGAVRALLSDAGAQVLEERDIRPFNGSSVAPTNSLKERGYALGSFPFTVRCARRLIKEVQPDLVHLNSTCLVAAAVGAHMASPRLPVIAHVREPLLPNRWGRLLAYMNNKNVDHFIGIDQAGVESLGTTTVPSDVIYNFVSDDLFSRDNSGREQCRAHWGWPEGEVIFLFLARVAPSNGPLEMVNLIEANSHRLHPAARFVIAGFPKVKSEYALAAYEAASRSSRCVALDFVEEPIPLIAAADVVIAPFVTPHSARSIFEGAALGRPGLVSEMPHLAELVKEGQTGSVFRWQDPDTFVSSVNGLCDDGTRERMGQAAVEFAAMRFSRKRAIEATMSLYDRLLARQ